MKRKSIYVNYLCIFFIFYCLICLMIYSKQQSLLYFPNSNIYYDTLLFKEIKLNNKVLALETISQSVKPLKTIVFFHGNSGSAANRLFYKQFFNKIISSEESYKIIIAEYPGFGINYKEQISKKNLVSHAQEVMKYVLKHEGGEIIVVGESLGTGIASQMANEFNINKLLLITPYSSISDVAQNKFWYLPIPFLLKDNYNSIDNLKNYSGNVFFIISELDDVILPQFAFKLFDSINVKKEKTIVFNANHNNWIEHFNAENINKINKFLNKDG